MSSANSFVIRNTFFGGAAAAALLAGACAAPMGETPAQSPTHARDGDGPFRLGEVHELEREASISDILGVSDAINPRDGAAYRTYRVTLEADTIVSVRAQSSSFSPALSVLAADGTLIGATPQAGAPARPTAQLVRRVPTDGTYYVVVSASESGQHGSFDLRTELVDPNPSLTYPGRVDGFLYPTGRVHPTTGAPMQVFPIDLEEPATLEINLRSRDFDAYLTLAEADTSRVLSQNDDWGGSTDSRILAELSAGSYEIWATALNPNAPDGSYTLEVSPGVIQRSESFTLGQEYIGFLGLDRQTVPGSERTGEAIRFRLDEATVLQATMRTTEFDSYLVLTDAAGNVITEDDDSGGGHDARIVQPLEPGAYVLWATAFGPLEGGGYRLQTSLLEDSAETSVSLGASLRAILTAGGEVYPGRGSPVRYYDLRLAREDTVTIDLQSSDFDAYLVLEDNHGRVIAENDDAAPGTTDAQIRLRLDAGAYRVGVTSYEPHGTGQFSLAVRGSAAPSRAR
jgi:hypothetical protein